MNHIQLRQSEKHAQSAITSNRGGDVHDDPLEEIQLPAQPDKHFNRSILKDSNLKILNLSPVAGGESAATATLSCMK